MADEIPLRPPIPAQLRTAATRGSLVPFVGAGVSMLAGCPDWSQFAQGALRLFIDAGKLNHSQLRQIGQLSPRTQISLAMAMSREHRITIDYAKLLQPHGVPSEKGRRAYASIEGLANTFVTTNYDDLLDTVIALPASANDPAIATSSAIVRKRTAYYRVEDFTYAALSRGDCVFHIHGSTREPRGMVLTTGDYLARYANHSVTGGTYKENKYLEFLETLFLTKNVLFIGYSLGELEILEYVVQKARAGAQSIGPDGKPEELRHFMLMGFFSHELELMQRLKQYYAAECGVELIPFSKDQRDWDQLCDVLEYLAEELPAQSLLQLHKREELRRLFE